MNTTAIIYDLEHLETSILGEYFKRRCSSVNSILDEFLESVYRGNNDLAGGNLVHNAGVEGLQVVALASEPDLDVRLG